MNHIKEISMIISILTRGWIPRVFNLLLWIIAIGIAIFKGEENMTLAVILMASVNGVFYLQITSRLQILVSSDMGKILPHYFARIKKALLVLLFLSFTPTLAFLPNIEQWLSLLSVLIVIAVIAVALSYQPRYYWVLAVLLVMPVSIDMFKSTLDPIDFKFILSCLLPLIAWLAYSLLTKLETFKGNKEHIERLQALNSLSPKKMVLSQESIPLASRNKVWQWLTNKNFVSYRAMIHSKRSANHQLIDVACQDLDTVGKFTYVIWFGLTLTLIALSKIVIHFELVRESVFYVLAVICPAAMLAGGSITTFRTINTKRSLLNRLAIMPCFNEGSSFSKAFITYFLLNEVKLYGFILLMVGLFAYSYDHISVAMYFNVVLMGVVMLAVNAIVMFITWHSRTVFEGVAMWLILLNFVLANLFLLFIAKEGTIDLIHHKTFIALMVASFLLLTMRLYANPERLFKGE